MKTQITTLLTILLLAFCLCGTKALASPSISLTQTGYTGYLYTVFEVEVWLDSDDLTGNELLSFGFDVEVADETIYRYAGYLLGSDFEYLESAAKWGFVGGTSFLGVTDQEVLLATLYFTIMGEGSCDLSINAEYDDSLRGLFYVDFDSYEDLSCSVSYSAAVGSPVPAPSSLLLMGGGIAVLCAAMRRARKRGGIV